MTSGSKRRAAVLIANPNAGPWSGQSRATVVEALRAAFAVEAYATAARDTGITIAAEAAEAGAELVIAFGGDGHVNEVANGLAGTSASLGIIPGGTMNVFARALGVPLDPFKAIDHLVGAYHRPSFRVPLGRMDERYFTFSAGCGFDAEAAERVERYVPAKRRLGEMWFYWSAFRVLAGSYKYRRPSMILRGDFGRVAVAMAIACNAGPYAYLAGRRVNLAPNVRLHGGLDVFALKTMRAESVPAYAWRVMVSGDLVHHPDVIYESDLEEFELSSPQPFSRHVDGEPLAPARSAHFKIVPGILKVRA
jgi:diacylglycerol kinase family enzyme